MSLQAIKELSDTAFARCQELMMRLAGIKLGPSKRSLVCARLNRRLNELRLDCYEAYFDRVERDPKEIQYLLDALSTNVTSFFREDSHFPVFADHLKKEFVKGTSRIRLWSCASSSGQEPYTMAMVLAELLGSQACDWRILATDINSCMLATGKTGRYPIDQLSSIPGQYHRYCQSTDTDFTITSALRSQVLFKSLNLSQPPFPMRGPMQAVFCRNVLIYFPDEVQQALLKEIHRVLAPNGLLFVGHSEGLANRLEGFSIIQPSVYRKQELS